MSAATTRLAPVRSLAEIDRALDEIASELGEHAFDGIETRERRLLQAASSSATSARQLLRVAARYQQERAGGDEEPMVPIAHALSCAKAVAAAAGEDPGAAACTCIFSISPRP